MRWAKVILGAMLEIAIVVALLATLRYASGVQDRLIGAPSADDRLFLAAWQGDDELFDQAVRDGGGASARDSQGSTPLHFAAQSGHVRLARRLLELGADVNATNAWGVTPLMYAGSRNRERVVALLLEAGADSDLRTCDGN